jgi:hypothetical protein
MSKRKTPPKKLKPPAPRLRGKARVVANRNARRIWKMQDNTNVEDVETT